MIDLLIVAVTMILVGGTTWVVLRLEAASSPAAERVDAPPPPGDVTVSAPAGAPVELRWTDLDDVQWRRFLDRE